MESVPFACLVEDELATARRDHTINIHNLAEAYVIVREKIDELWDIVRKKPRDRDPKETLAELVQISAMAQRTAEDLGLV